jgi:hypothetical protein
MMQKIFPRGILPSFDAMLIPAESHNTGPASTQGASQDHPKQ